MKNPLAVGSIIVLVAIVLMIVIVPRVVPYGYSDIVTINGVRDISGAEYGTTPVVRSGAGLYR